MENSSDTNVDIQVVSWLKQLDFRFKVIFAGTFLWGFAAHGMALFNKYCLHDDIPGLFGIGATYNLGRWFLGVMGSVFSVFSGSGHFSTPLPHGFLSFFCIAISLYLIVNLLDIKRPLLLVCLSGIFVCFPMLAGLFGYMFTAPYYMIGLMLGVFGVWVILKYRKWYFLIIGALCVACSVGTYQAYLPVYLTIMLLYYLRFVDGGGVL